MRKGDKEKSVCGKGVEVVVRMSRNEAPLVPVFLKGEKKVAATNNNLRNLTSIPSQV